MDANERKQAGGTLDPNEDEEVRVPGQIRRVSEFLDSALEQARRRCAGVDKPVPLPWPKLARAYGGGWWPGLHMIVGKPKSGKSQFTLQAAFHAAQAGVPVLYVGLELGDLDIVARLACLDDDVRGLERGKQRGIAWSELYLGKLEEDVFDAVAANARKRLAELPLYLEVGGPHGWPYGYLYEVGADLRRRHPEGPAMLVLDFLQIVGDAEEGGRRLDTRERVMHAAYAGRAVAREFGITVVFVSSTARDYYKRIDAAGNVGSEHALSISKSAKEDGFEASDPSSLMGTGKESGEVEYSCDTITVLCPQRWPNPPPGQPRRPPPSGTKVRVALAGGRAVQPDFGELWFDGTCFGEGEKVE